MIKEQNEIEKSHRGEYKKLIGEKQKKSIVNELKKDIKKENIKNNKKNTGGKI